MWFLDRHLKEAKNNIFSFAEMEKGVKTKTKTKTKTETKSKSFLLSKRPRNN
jgi:hypothetical protein